MTGITQQPEKSHSITDAFHLFGFKSSPKKKQKTKGLWRLWDNEVSALISYWPRVQSGLKWKSSSPATFITHTYYSDKVWIPINNMTHRVYAAVFGPVNNYPADKASPVSYSTIYSSSPADQTLKGDKQWVGRTGSKLRRQKKGEVDLRNQNNASPLADNESGEIGFHVCAVVELDEKEIRKMRLRKECFFKLLSSQIMNCQLSLCLPGRTKAWPRLARLQTIEEQDPQHFPRN